MLKSRKERLQFTQGEGLYQYTTEAQSLVVLPRLLCHVGSAGIDRRVIIHTWNCFEPIVQING